MADDDQLARMCKVLSAPARLRIVRLLKRRSLCVGALCARLEVTQGAVSQHLRILRDAGLVTSDRRGNFIHYRVDERALNKWKTALDRLMAMGDR